MWARMVMAGLWAIFVGSGAVAQEQERGYYLKLENGLDRPLDGYCLDVAEAANMCDWISL